MSIAQQLANEEALLGTWPRRLLHIPTWTSLKWQPGNYYGQHHEPKYNALTYTWGRFRENDPVVAAAIGSLPIDRASIDWDIPVIRKHHFQVHQFKQVLQLIAARVPTSYNAETGGLVAELEKYDPVEFVWLDVACIDQNWNSPRGDAEIGRQAVIFEGAQAVYAWFWTLDEPTLAKKLKIASDFTTVFNEVGSSPRATNKLIQAAMQASAAMATITKDHWFSSLWTLQEAFLRQDAFILARDGSMFRQQARELHLQTRLQYLFEDMNILVDYCQSQLKATTTPAHDASTIATLSAISDAIHKLGVQPIVTQNALSTFCCASERQTTHAEDRIYAIQQVFRFRLGKTSLDPTMRIRTSPQELEEQFSAQLLKTYPLRCHLFVNTLDPLPGKGWMIDRSAVVPNTNRFGDVWDLTDMATGPSQTVQTNQDVEPFDFREEAVQPDPGLEPYDLHEDDDLPPPADILGSPIPDTTVTFVVKQIGTQQMAEFEGVACAFPTLAQACTNLEEWLMTDQGRLGGSDNILAIFPDNSAELVAIGEVWNAHMPIRTDASPAAQEALVRKLCQAYSPDALQVLYLGHDGKEQYGLGLLLVERPQSGFSYWRRLAVLSWHTGRAAIGAVESPQLPFLRVHQGWIPTTGLLG